MLLFIIKHCYSFEYEYIEKLEIFIFFQKETPVYFKYNKNKNTIERSIIRTN